MSIHMRGPLSWAGGPIGHTSAKAGVAAIAAVVPSMARRVTGLNLVSILPGTLVPLFSSVSGALLKGAVKVARRMPSQHDLNSRVHGRQDPAGIRDGGGRRWFRAQIQPPLPAPSCWRCAA